MPHLTTDDGVRLYYEETGSGTPIVFVHEFADDYRGYELQLRYFGRRYRCIAYNARGYPPSDVPADPARYSQDRARDDIRAVLDALGISKAHVVGISMGGFATFISGWPIRSAHCSLVVAGCGYGAEPGKAPAIPRRDREDRGADRKRRHAGRGSDLRERPRACAIPEQRPARLGRICRASRRAFDPRLGQHDAWCAGAPPVVVGPDRPHAPARSSYSDHDRRRGRPLPRTGSAHETHDPDRRARRLSQHRARCEPRGAGALQPHMRGLLPSGRERPLAAPRSAFAVTGSILGVR